VTARDYAVSLGGMPHSLERVGVGYSFAGFQGVTGVSLLNMFNFGSVGVCVWGMLYFSIPTAMRRGTPKTRKSSETCSLNKSIRAWVQLDKKSKVGDVEQ